ncbi:MAG: hypothetical protein ACT4RN_10005 [Pseudonocardia sp.]
MSAPRRESVPMTPAEVGVVERLMHRSGPERDALAELVPDVGTSRASVLHALLSVGVQAVRERVREGAYAELAATADGEGEREIRLRRRRQAAGWRDEP